MNSPNINIQEKNARTHIYLLWECSSIQCLYNNLAKNPMTNISSYDSAIWYNGYKMPVEKVGGNY